MYPVIENNKGLGTVTGKRCGWLCKALHNVGSVLVRVPGLADFGAIVLAASDAVSWIESNIMKTTSSNEYEPTPSEEIILDTWVNKNLTPFVEKLTSELNTALLSRDFGVQLSGINLTLRRICLLNIYFATNETKGLSPAAVTLRLALIEEISLPIDELIGNSLAGKTIDYVQKVVSFNASEFTGIITSASSYNCNQYQLQKSVNPSDQLPISQDTIIGAVNDTIAATTNITPTTSTPEKESKGGLLLLAAIILIAIGLSSDKKEKKSKNN